VVRTAGGTKAVRRRAAWRETLVEVYRSLPDIRSRRLPGHAGRPPTNPAHSFSHRVAGMEQPARGGDVQEASITRMRYSRFIDSRRPVTRITRDIPMWADWWRRNDQRESRTHPQRNILTRALGTNPDLIGPPVARALTRGRPCSVATDSRARCATPRSHPWKQAGQAGRELLELAANRRTDNIYGQDSALR